MASPRGEQRRLSLAWFLEPIALVLKGGVVLSDLAAQPNIHRTINSQAVIVGAGVAGLILAARLRRSNMKVTVLESGDRQQTAETHPLNRVVQLGDSYAGASRGRFRCLGGTSTRWGGALIPFAEGDFKARPYLGLDAFPVSQDDLSPYLREVESLFGIDQGSYEEEFIKEFGAAKHLPVGDTDFHARFAKWPTFKRRNLAAVFKEMVASDPDVDIVVNATATDFDADERGGQIRSVTARHQNGKSLTVAAKYFIVCGGAIETTRLLLLLDRQYDQRIFANCEALGRGFYDHISAAVATIRAHDATRLNQLAALRFVGSTMRSLRFELSSAAQSEEQIGSANAHISFRSERETGFDALRHLMRSRQRRQRFQRAHIVGLLSDLPYMTRLALWRAVHNQLLWPSPAIYELHVVAEQLPRPENRIALSDQQDAFGLPVATIDWRVAASDRRTFSVVQKRFAKYWERRGLNGIGELIWGKGASDAAEGASQFDVYHPGGSTRMGTDRRTAVVDANLRVFGVRNLWAASTAAFPSGGGANPTLTLMLMTMRLADFLTSDAQRQ